MKVKFLVNTAYQGPRVEGDVVDVPKDFAERWAKNGIAEIVGDVEVEPPAPPVEEPEKEPEVEAEDTVDYEQMSAKDLYNLCVEKGIEVEAKQPKAYYIEKLA